MILQRLGSKKAVAKKIIPHFPPHKLYIEPFFGAGGMFFQKPKAKYNIVNDSDSDVFNLFKCVMNRKDELTEAFRIMPIHQDLLNHWKTNKEDEPIRKALRFLFLSNLTFLGKGNTINYGRGNNKNGFNEGVDFVFTALLGVKFNNCDFQKFLKSIPKNPNDFEPLETFSYNDPPYLNTDNNYECGATWTEQDVINVFDANEKTGCKYAYSEFNHPFLLEQAKERNLNVITIGERQNLKNRRTEILITNYDSPVQTLF